MDVITVGRPLPKIVSVLAHDGLRVRVEWSDGRDHETVDLSPIVHRYRIYRPLRDNPDLFATVHVVDEGAAIAWGTGDIDMSAVVVERASDACASARLRDTLSGGDSIGFMP